MQSNIILKKIVPALLVLIIFSAKIANAQFGGTLTCNGSTQSFATPNGMQNGATVFTIELWVKTTETGSNGTFWQRPTLIGTTSAGAPSGDFGITTNNGFIGMWSGLNSGGDNSFLSGTVQINDNNWHHIAAVNNGSNIKLFADGILTGTISSGLGLATNAAPLTVGSSSLDFNFSGNVGIANFFHQGIYDEVRFSNNVRYTTNFTVPSAAFTTDANTVALYHLDGCVNGLVPDASANANNGRPHNFTGSCAFALPPPPNIPANITPQNISKAEYYYDTDPGFGQGNDIPVTASTDVTGSYAVNTVLPNGAHRLYTRTKMSDGKWSLTNNAPVFIVPVTPAIAANKPPSRILKAEYFYDSDPGFGQGTNIPIAPTFDLSGSFAVNLTGLTSGVHRIYLRTQDSVKSWSLTNIGSFYLLPIVTTIPANTNPANISKAEYFIDTDPGFGQGTDIPVTTSSDVTINNAFINLTGLSNGVHRVYVRTKNINGRWSLTNLSVFSIVAASVTIPANPVAGNITKFEYFFDTDPGFGNGTKINVTPTLDLNNYSFVADVSALNDGTHTLYIRTYDGWSITNTRSFTKGSILPVSWLSFNAVKIADSVLLSWKTTNEHINSYYQIERSSDGNLFSKIGIVTATNNSSTISSYNFTDTKPMQGLSYYRIKQVDKDGVFKYSKAIAIRFTGNPPVVSVYPNPAGKTVNIEFPIVPPAGTKIELFSINGQLVKSLFTNGNSINTIDISDVATGVYQIKITDKATLFSEKIIVQH